MSLLLIPPTSTIPVPNTSIPTQISTAITSKPEPDSITTLNSPLGVVTIKKYNSPDGKYIAVYQSDDQGDTGISLVDSNNKGLTPVYCGVFDSWASDSSYIKILITKSCFRNEVDEEYAQVYVDSTVEPLHPTSDFLPPPILVAKNPAIQHTGVRSTPKSVQPVVTTTPEGEQLPLPNLKYTVPSGWYLHQIASTSRIILTKQQDLPTIPATEYYAYGLQMQFYMVHTNKNTDQFASLLSRVDSVSTVSTSTLIGHTVIETRGSASETGYKMIVNYVLDGNDVYVFTLYPVFNFDQPVDSPDGMNYADFKQFMNGTIRNKYRPVIYD